MITCWLRLDTDVFELACTVLNISAQILLYCFIFLLLEVK